MLEVSFKPTSWSRTLVTRDTNGHFCTGNNGSLHINRNGQNAFIAFIRICPQARVYLGVGFTGLFGTGGIGFRGFVLTEGPGELELLADHGLFCVRLISDGLRGKDVGLSWSDLTCFGNGGGLGLDTLSVALTVALGTGGEDVDLSWSDLTCFGNGGGLGLDTLSVALTVALGTGGEDVGLSWSDLTCFGNGGGLGLDTLSAALTVALGIGGGFKAPVLAAVGFAGTRGRDGLSRIAASLSGRWFIAGLGGRGSAGGLDVLCGKPSNCLLYVAGPFGLI